MSDKILVQEPEIKIYKSIDNAELEAHIFYSGNSSSSDKNPGFVFFHPGGWTEGEPMWCYDLCRHFASKGMIAISFQYRLSSPDGYTPIDAISDAKDAIIWTKQNVVELKIDPERIVAGGISAGAHIVTCATFIEGGDNKSESDLVVKALALQSAVVNPLELDQAQEFVDLLQGADPEKYSPYHLVRSGLPPMCLIHGTADDIVPYDSVEEFTDKMIEAGNRCDLYPFEGVDHFFSNNPDDAKMYDIIDKFFASLGFIEG